MVRTRRQKATADYLSKLSPEILRCVFGYFCSHCCNEYQWPFGAPPGSQNAQDFKTLYNLCLVSRYLRGIAQEILYHSFDLKLPNYINPNPWVHRLEPFLQTVASRPDLARSVKAVILEVPLIQALDFNESRKAFDDCALALGSSAREIYHKGYDTRSSVIKRAFFRGTPEPEGMRLEDFIPTVASELLSVLVAIFTNLSHLGVAEDYQISHRWEFDVSTSTLDILGITSIPLKTFESDRALDNLLSRSTGLDTLVTLGRGHFPPMPTVESLHLRSPAAIYPEYISKCLSACTGALTTLTYTAVDCKIKDVFKCIDLPKLHASVETLHLDMKDRFHLGPKVLMPSLKDFTKIKTLLIHTFHIYETASSPAPNTGDLVEGRLARALPPNITSLILAKEEEAEFPLINTVLGEFATSTSPSVFFPHLRYIGTNVGVLEENVIRSLYKNGIKVVCQDLPRCRWNCTAELVLDYHDVDEYNVRYNGQLMPLPGELSDDDL